MNLVQMKPHQGIMYATSAYQTSVKLGIKILLESFLK